MKNQKSTPLIASRWDGSHSSTAAKICPKRSGFTVIKSGKNKNAESSTKEEDDLSSGFANIPFGRFLTARAERAYFKCIFCVLLATEASFSLVIFIRAQSWWGSVVLVVAVVLWRAAWIHGRKAGNLYLMAAQPMPMPTAPEPRPQPKPREVAEDDPSKDILCPL